MWKRLAVALVLIAVHAGASLCVPMLEPLQAGSFSQQLQLVLLGVVLVQPLMLGTVGVLGPYAFVKQFSGGAIAAVCAAVILTSRQPVIDAPMFVFVFISCAVFCLSVGASAIVRTTLWKRIVVAGNAGAAMPEARQFTIRSLLILTAAAACMLAVISYLRPFSRGGEVDEVVRITKAAWPYLPELLGPWLVFLVLLAPWERRWLAALAAALAVNCAISAACTFYWHDRSTNLDYLRFLGGMLAGVTITALALRWAGYRLVRVPQSAKPA